MTAPRPDAERRRARLIAWSVGLSLWSLGAGVCLWAALRLPAADLAAAGWALFISAIMLVAFALAVESDASADPVAHAWWLLTLYAVFPANGASWVLLDTASGSTDWTKLAAVVPAVLLVRATLLLTPWQRRFISIEIRHAIDDPTARRWGPVLASIYLAAAAIVVIAMTFGESMLAFGALIFGYLGVQLAGRTVRRRSGGSRVTRAAAATSVYRP